MGAVHVCIGKNWKALWLPLLCMSSPPIAQHSPSKVILDRCPQPNVGLIEVRVSDVIIIVRSKSPPNGPHGGKVGSGSRC